MAGDGIREHLLRFRVTRVRLACVGSTDVGEETELIGVLDDGIVTVVEGRKFILPYANILLLEIIE
ncbi:MAG: hypothetical protein ABW128_16980 [Rhizorhabdus sp.]